ncbi:uncharacterized protein LOC144772779 [Lissotriton helveticus]
MEPPEYSNFLTLQLPSETSTGAAGQAGTNDDDSYSNIYQDVLAAGPEGRNRGNSFQEPRTETLRRPNGEVKAGKCIVRRGGIRYSHRAKRLIVKFLPLLVVFLLMWLILLVLILVKYKELSANLKTAELDHSAMTASDREMAGKLKAAELKFSATMESNIEMAGKLKATELKFSATMESMSKGLLDVQSSLNEMKQRLESDVAALRVKVDSLYTCPTGWKAHAVSCYYFSSEQLPWESAKRDCIGRGSRLVTVESPEEQMFLAQNLNGKVHWIGLSDSAQEGIWQWVNMAPVLLSFWRTGEPNDARGLEDCVEIEHTATWNDAFCSTYNKWICETSRF